MKKYNKAIGAYGETIARDFLTTNGYKILDMNYRNRCGEIDIICKNNNIIIFCEIKSEKSSFLDSIFKKELYYRIKF